LKIRNTASGLQKQPLGALHSNSGETTTTEDKKNISDLQTTARGAAKQLKQTSTTEDKKNISNLQTTTRSAAKQLQQNN
jgi:hypothetical protein